MKSDMYTVNAAECICGISLHKKIFCSVVDIAIILHPAEMKPNMTETSTSIRSLQNTIDKYKKFTQEQVQVIVQKEMLVKSLRSGVAKLKQLLEEKTREVELQEKRKGRLESDLRDIKKRLKSEEESCRRWYHLYREKEEELAKEKTAWEKFREKHHFHCCVLFLRFLYLQY